MKLTTLLPLIVLVGAFVVGPMYIKGPTGDPMMQPKDWVPEPVQKVAEAAKPKLEVYKWTDENGVVQYSDARPGAMADEAVETIEVAEVMTMPKTAFTGDVPPAKAAGNEGPRVAILPYGSSSERSGGDRDPGVPGEGMPLVPSSAPAMNEALAEIGQRFPQFKAMSDAMAKGSAGSAEEPAGE
jgi:hypothetical protein